MARRSRPAKVSERDRAYLEAQGRSLKEAELDTELTPEQRDALRKSTNEVRAEKGLPPLADEWEDTPTG